MRQGMNLPIPPKALKLEVKRPSVDVRTKFPSLDPKERLTQEIGRLSPRPLQTTFSSTSGSASPEFRQEKEFDVRDTTFPSVLVLHKLVQSAQESGSIDKTNTTSQEDTSSGVTAQIV